MSNPCVQVFTGDRRGDYLKQPRGIDDSFVSSVLESGIQRLATNFISDELAVSFGNASLFGTVTDKECENSPICSPFNLFCLYPKKKIRHIKASWLRHVLNAGTSLFSLTFRAAKFDRVIQLNNKPCDAITYPELSSTEIVHCVRQLKKAHPGHAIIFPRIDKLTSPDLFDHLRSNGFLMVPTRTVHIFHPDSPYMKRSHTKRDRGLLRKRDYALVEHDEITDTDLERIIELYKMLFIEKHGKESPALTSEFFKKGHANRWYTFFALRNPKGVIDAFLSYETRGNVMACGPLGYDTAQEKGKGLYRMVFARSLEIADEKRYIFNFGGGNEHFKMNRGSRREIGYTAVYCSHLPLYRKLPWQILEAAGRRITVKLFEKVTF